MTVLTEMFDALRSARPEVLPSAFWEHYNQRNLAQLDQDGYDNFKRTIVLNYFTSIPMRRGDYQLAFLRRHLSPTKIAECLVRAALTPGHELFTWKQSRTYTFLTLLIWEYVRSVDRDGLLNRLTEPLDGNPPRIYKGGRLISQDIANSTLEFKSVMDTGIPPERIKTIIELGAGYGRTAYVFLSLMPRARYIIADIPPALYLSQTYLSRQFPDRKVFGFRPFSSYGEVADELEKADIAFLLPHQLDLLPDQSADLFLNISSLHEMRRDQIDHYFNEIERLTSGYLYLKQWKESQNPFDGLIVREGDYPVRPTWSRVYWRECRIHTRFFEALLDLRGHARHEVMA
jgi:putative sugar O-methyltransferase